MDDAIDAIEEMNSHAFLCQELAHVGGNLRTVVVFQLVENIADEGMSLVIEEGASLLDRFLVPKHLCHLVVVGLFPGIGSRHAEQTFYAYHLLPASEHISANGAGSGEE